MIPIFILIGLSAKLANRHLNRTFAAMANDRIENRYSRSTQSQPTYVQKAV